MNIETSKALSSLDFAIENLIPVGKKDDEFTVSEFSEKTGLSPSATLSQLKSLVKVGMLKSRKVIINGRNMNVFQKP
jgi:predicted transcriptional regulator